MCRRMLFETNGLKALYFQPSRNFQPVCELFSNQVVTFDQFVNFFKPVVTFNQLKPSLLSTPPGGWGGQPDVNNLHLRPNTATHTHTHTHTHRYTIHKHSQADVFNLHLRLTAMSRSANKPMHSSPTARVAMGESVGQ